MRGASTKLGTESDIGRCVSLNTHSQHTSSKEAYPDDPSHHYLHWFLQHTLLSPHSVPGPG